MNRASLTARQLVAASHVVRAAGELVANLERESWGLDAINGEPEAADRLCGDAAESVAEDLRSLAMQLDRGVGAVEADQVTEEIQNLMVASAK